MLLTPRNLILEDRGVCQLVNSSTEKKQLNWIEKSGSSCIFILRESVTFEQQKKASMSEFQVDMNTSWEKHTPIKKKKEIKQQIYLQPIDFQVISHLILFYE